MSLIVQILMFEAAMKDISLNL